MTLKTSLPESVLGYYKKLFESSKIIFTKEIIEDLEKQYQEFGLCDSCNGIASNEKGCKHPGRCCLCWSKQK